MYWNRSFPTGTIQPEISNWNCVTARAQPHQVSEGLSSVGFFYWLLFHLTFHKRFGTMYIAEEQPSSVKNKKRIKCPG